ncbi:MAG TPA: aminopeptidase P N-terminal domain-containing protein [Terriglobales bacterium]|nr:aminopeptidase P N-terminal domain-containing protein [Terriglobales bacterium]
MKKAVAFLLLCAVSTVWSLDRQPNADYRARREALAKKASGSAVLLFAPTEAEGPNAVYGFRQDDNFFYLSGWVEPGAALLIVPAAEASGNMPARPYAEILFLAANNKIEEKWTGPKLSAADPNAPKITGFDKVEVLDQLRDELTRLLPERPTVYTDLPGYGHESASTSALDWLKRSNAFIPFASYKDVKSLLSSLRTIKDAGEIELIRKASNATVAAHLAAMRAMKPGITEREISALLQYEWGKRGCERLSYAPIVGSGFNSTVLHYSEDSATIHDGDVVVIDAAGEYSMYATDITRTLPANGKFTTRQREIYDIVLGAQQAAIAAFQAGKSTIGKDTPNSLFKVAYDYINTHGKDLHGEPLGKYFIHGLGHYVGLAVHDPDDYSVALGPGAVFTIEPGIYIPEEKLGVRIEDTLYVDASGKLINLGAALPRTTDEVERAMAGK